MNNASLLVDPRKSSPPPEVNIPPISGRHRSVNNHSSFIGRLNSVQEPNNGLTPTIGGGAGMHLQRHYGSLAYTPKVDYQSLNLPGSLGTNPKLNHLESCVTPNKQSSLFPGEKNRSQSRVSALDRKVPSQLRQPVQLA